MTNSRKRWLCPLCPHRASRKGNMKVHIQRWHGGNKQPLYIGEQTETLLKNHQGPSSLGSNTVNSKSPPSPILKSSKSPESVFEFINELHSQVIEARGIPRKIEEIQSFFNGDLLPHLHTNKSSSHFALTNF